MPRIKRLLLFGALIFAGVALSACDTITITVTADPNPADIGETIQFNVSCAGDDCPDLGACTADWDFDDTGTGTGQSPTHAYAAAGVYDVEVDLACDGLPDTTEGITVYVREDNPPLPDECGLDVALVFDGSDSIGSTSYTQQQDAFNLFVDALLDETPSQFSIVEFATLSSLRYQFSDPQTEAAVSAEIGQPREQPGGPYTNWQQGLLTAHSVFTHRVNADVLIFASDGDPNRTGDPAQSADTVEAVSAAVLAANAIKADGIRIIAIGIGDDVDLDNLAAISSDDAVITSTFETLADELGELASELCGGTISVRKVIDSDIGVEPGEGWLFDAIVDGPASSNPISDTTDADGKTTFSIDFSGEVSATVDISETLKPGYAFVTASCTGTTYFNGTLGPGIVEDIELGEDDIVSCVFTNTLTAATRTLTLTKMLVPDTDGGTFDLKAGDTTVVAGASHGAFGTVAVAGGVSVTVSEVGAGGTELGDYMTEILCASTDEVAVASDTISATFTMPVDRDVTCTFTNTRLYTPTLTLMKMLDPFDDGGTFDLMADGTVVVPGASDGDEGSIKIEAGTPVTVSEVATGTADLSHYTSILSCNTAGGVVASGTTSTTFDMPEVDVTCEFSNTRKTRTLTLTKMLDPVDDPGTFDLTAGDSLVVPAATHNVSGSLTIDVGDEVEVLESGAGGTDLDHYMTEILCASTDEVAVASDTISATFPMPDKDVTCTFTNTRKVHDVTLVKALDPTDDFGAFDLWINDSVVSSAAQDDDSGQALDVPVGSLVVLSETMASGEGLSEYTTTLSCDVLTPAGLNPGGFEMPDSDVTCTYSNTRKPPEMIIDKDVLTQPPVVEPGGQVRWQIIVTNNGGGSAYGVTIWDLLPAGFTYASTDNINEVGGATRGATINPTPGEADPHWSAWRFPPGARVEIEFTVDVADTVGPGTYDNTAYADGANFEQIDDDGLVAQDASTPPDEDPEVDEDIRVLATVGGFVEPVRTVRLLAPWLGLAALMAIAIAAVVDRRRVA